VSCNLILLCTGSINSDHSKTWKLPWLNKHKINKDLKQGKYPGQNKHKINKERLETRNTLAKTSTKQIKKRK